MFSAFHNTILEGDKKLTKVPEVKVDIIVNMNIWDLVEKVPRHTNIAAPSLYARSSLAYRSLEDILSAHGSIVISASVNSMPIVLLACLYEIVAPGHRFERNSVKPIGSGGKFDWAKAEFKPQRIAASPEDTKGRIIINV